MIRRARPMLGTIVDICLPEAQPEDNAVIDLAFARVQAIEDMMSFHRLDSDLNRINNAAPGYLEVPAELVYVLKVCIELECNSHGVFNPNIAKFLIDQELLPQRKILAALKPLKEALTITSSSVLILKDRVALDLGGIAKGYAVDEACRILQENGMKEGIVNAGGDIRVFGDNSYNIAIRHPENPGQTAMVINLKSEALASSASYFMEVIDSKNRKSAIVDGRSGQRCFSNKSVSIKAASCIMADALTKLPFILEELEMEHLLERYDAQMFVLSSDSPRYYNHLTSVDLSA